jgi:hypothetical protein
VKRKTLAVGIGAVAMIVAVSASSTAQSLGDRFAYSAILRTPVGAVPTSPVIGTAHPGSTSWSAYYGLVPSEGTSPSTRHMVASYSMGAMGGRTTLSGGLNECAGCRSAGVEVGADWLTTTRQNEFTLGFRPAVGYARNDGVNAWAAALSVPIAWTPAGVTGFRISPFVEPGLGVGGMWESGSQTGSRLMTSGGLVFSSTNSPLAVTTGARKVFLDGGRTIYGLGVTWGNR